MTCSSSQICGNEESLSSVSVHSGLTSRAEESGPIARIPVEILAEIFFLLQYHSSDDLWIRILQVCTYWRSVALGTARLWTQICDHRESQATLSRTLSCSGQLPLDLRMNFRGMDTAFFAQALFPHRLRVETLSVVLSTPEDLGLLYAVPLPAVYMVTLRSENLQSTFPLAHFDSAVFLQLKDMNVAFNTSNLAKLTALAIDNSRSSLPNVVNLISVLRMAPALKSLTLTGRWIPRTAEEQNNLRNTQVFQAQQLKDVHLRTEAAFVREFFSVVSVSASSQIHLHVWAAAGQEGTGTGLNLGDALPDKDRIHHIGCIKSAKILTVTLEGDDEPCLLYFDEVTRGALCIYPTLARIPDAFHWQDVVDQCVDAMEQLALSTVSERITTLSLRDDPFGHLAALDLYSLFHSLPNLRILLVKARRIDTVLDALRALEMDSEDQFGVLCQKLAAIRLEDLVVDENVVNQIVACFETRMDVSECDLQALHMGGSDVDAELLEMLESICQRVRV